VIKQWEKEKLRRKALNGAPDTDYVRPTFTSAEEEVIDKYFNDYPDETVRETQMRKDLDELEMSLAVHDAELRWINTDPATV
jgi:hypothetical protein